jgi:cytochrome P450 family 4
MIHFWKRVNFFFNRTSAKARYDECLKILHDFTHKIIEKRRQTIIDDKKVETLDDVDDSVGIKKRMALLDVLLSSTINGKPLTNSDIAEEVDTFMFEGHDTVTAATCFTIYLLSQHSSVQQQVYEEITRIVGDDLSVDPTYNNLNDMKYLESCIKESLR